MKSRIDEVAVKYPKYRKNVSSSMPAISPGFTRGLYTLHTRAIQASHEGYTGGGLYVEWFSAKGIGRL